MHNRVPRSRSASSRSAEALQAVMACATGMYDRALSSFMMKRTTRKTQAATSALACLRCFRVVAIWIFFNGPQWSESLRNLPGALTFQKSATDAVTGVLAVGMLMVIVCGNIDLSVGAVVGLSGGMAALAQGWGLAPSLGAAIVVGLLIGAVQGTLVAYANIPAFIVTLGGLEAWRGVILKLTKGATIPIELPFFRSLGRDFIDPRLGIGFAIAGIAAIVWNNLRRKRRAPAPRTRGLDCRVDGHADLVHRGHRGIYLLTDKREALPIPVVVLLAVALGGAFLTANPTFVATCTRLRQPRRGALVRNQLEAIRPRRILFDGSARRVSRHPAYRARGQCFAVCRHTNGT